MDSKEVNQFILKETSFEYSLEEEQGEHSPEQAALAGPHHSAPVTGQQVLLSSRSGPSADPATVDEQRPFPAQLLPGPQRAPPTGDCQRGSTGEVAESRVRGMVVIGWK